MSETPPIEFLEDGPADADRCFVLAHGAGAGMRSAFLEAVAGSLAAAAWRVVRFEFPYMRRMTAGKGRRPPDRGPALCEAFAEAVAAVRERSPRVAIGGKSMGGRIASMVADDLGVDALVCFGYPFHPPARPDRPRVAHLATLRTSALVLQGDRDPFGGPDDVAGYDLASSIRVHWLPGAGHDLTGSRAAAVRDRAWREVGEIAARFLGPG